MGRGAIKGSFQRTSSLKRRNKRKWVAAVVGGDSKKNREQLFEGIFYESFLSDAGVMYNVTLEAIPRV